MIESQTFRKKRQEYLITMRKLNREEILMKRRNIGENTIQLSEKDKLIIVDQSFRSYLKEIMLMSFQQNSINQLLKLLKSGNIYQKHKAIIGIRKLSVSCLDELINKQIISMFVNLCQQDDYLQIKLQSLWILTNISSTSQTASELQVQCNIIPAISNALDHKNKNIVYQAIWTGSNLAADSIKYRDELIQMNSIMKIIRFLDSNNSTEMISIATWALTNLARGNPSPKYDEVKAVVPVISQILKSKIITNQRTISDCLWTLTNLSDGPKIRVQRLLQTKVLPTVMQYLHHPNYLISIPSIRIVGNVTTGNRQQTNQVLKNNFLDLALPLLQKQKWVMVKQTCWALSNITAGNDQQILQFLQRQDLIKKLLHIYKYQVIQVKNQIIWIFTNMERASIPEMILKLYINIGIVEMIGQLFQDDTKIINEGLVCLSRIIKLGQKCKKSQKDQNPIIFQSYKFSLLQKLNNLQQNKCQKVSNQATKILDLFFPPQQPMNDT